METTQRDKDVGGLKSYSVMVPIIVVLAVLHIIVIVTIVQINSASAGLTAIMRKQGEYMKDATSLLAGSSLMSETSGNYVLKPNMDTGGININALAAYATEIQKPRRGNHVAERFRGYDVSEEIKSRIGVAAASANEMMKSQLHAIALVNSVYPMPDVEPLNKIPLHQLSEVELSYPVEIRLAAARNLILNPVYGLHKQSVSENINACTQAMENRASQLAAETGKRIAMLRMLLWGLTIVIMLLVFGTFALLYKQLVHPLNVFVKLIRSNSPLNAAKGMREVRLVAQAYNALLNRRDALDAILRSAAETDTLTNLPNRYRFEQYMLESGESGYSLAVLMFDINYLKKTNDTQGHHAGDMLIRNAADCITSCFGNACFRIGGDEFIAVIKGCDPEKLQSMIRDFEETKKQKHISISMGYAYAREIGETTVKQMMDEADKNMYAHKVEAHKVEAF